MDKKTCFSLTFSPTGSTAQVAQAIQAGMQSGEVLDVTVSGQPMQFQPGELVVFSVPVFGGRVPAPALERVKQLQGGGAWAAAVVVYGNRAYEDAMLELAAALSEAGFVVTGGAAFVARHSVTPAIASGRPNREDLEMAGQFGRDLVKKCAAGGAGPVQLPGNFPYRKFGGLPFQPVVSSSCEGCGVCAANCPTGAIPKEDPTRTDPNKCISCMRCVALCPRGARALPAEGQDAMAAKLARVCGSACRNEVFL